MSISLLSEDILLCIVSKLTPPWYPLTRLLLSCTFLSSSVRELIYTECVSMDMDPHESESTSSLLNALRYVRHAKAFWSIETCFTLNKGSVDTWVVKLDRIKGIVTVRRKSWERGKWEPLYIQQRHADFNERFIWSDGALQFLLSSTGDRFDVKLSEDKNTVELQRVVWAKTSGGVVARSSRFAYIGGI